MRFGCEDLDIWNRATDFAVKVIELIETINTGRKHFRLFEKIESSATSIPMNIAEGKGCFSPKEFTLFCFIARGSLYETITFYWKYLKKKAEFLKQNFWN